VEEVLSATIINRSEWECKGWWTHENYINC
jgi:hypothetical protein